jgi:hypothetical protein
MMGPLPPIAHELDGFLEPYFLTSWVGEKEEVGRPWKEQKKKVEKTETASQICARGLLGLQGDCGCSVGLLKVSGGKMAASPQWATRHFFPGM